MTRAPDGIYALRYATRDASVRGEHFIGHPEGCMDPWPIHYFVWAILDGDRVTLVDTGFTPGEAARRGNRNYGDSPVELLAKLGVAPGEVDRVILTHLHYDHTGFAGAFPRATVFLQRSELEFWLSPVAGRGSFAHLSLPEDLAQIEQLETAGRLELLSGDADLDETVSVHLVGGHTPGMQVVRVAAHREQKRAGTGDPSAVFATPIVLASDASHFYANLETDHPYAIAHNVPLMHLAFDRLRELAGPAGRIVPGHDPRVAERHRVLPGHGGTIIALSSPPGAR